MSKRLYPLSKYPLDILGQAPHPKSARKEVFVRLIARDVGLETQEPAGNARHLPENRTQTASQRFDSNSTVRSTWSGLIDSFDGTVDLSFYEKSF